MKQVIKINGMSCGACVKNVEEAISNIEGVSEVSVSLSQMQAEFQTDVQISDSDINKALSIKGNYSVSNKGNDKPLKSTGSCCC